MFKKTENYVLIEGRLYCSSVHWCIVMKPVPTTNTKHPCSPFWSQLQKKRVVGQLFSNDAEQIFQQHLWGVDYIYFDFSSFRYWNKFSDIIKKIGSTTSSVRTTSNSSNSHHERTPSWRWTLHIIGHHHHDSHFIIIKYIYRWASPKLTRLYLAQFPHTSTISHGIWSITYLNLSYCTCDDFGMDLLQHCHS